MQLLGYMRDNIVPAVYGDPTEGKNPNLKAS